MMIINRLYILILFIYIFYILSYLSFIIYPLLLWLSKRENKSYYI